MSDFELDRKAFALYNVGAKAVDKQKPSHPYEMEGF